MINSDPTYSRQETIHTHTRIDVTVSLFSFNWNVWEFFFKNIQQISDISTLLLLLFLTMAIVLFPLKNEFQKKTPLLFLQFVLILRWITNQFINSSFLGVSRVSTRVNWDFQWNILCIKCDINCYINSTPFYGWFFINSSEIENHRQIPYKRAFNALVIIEIGLLISNRIHVWFSNRNFIQVEHLHVLDLFSISVNGTLAFNSIWLTFRKGSSISFRYKRELCWPAVRMIVSRKKKQHLRTRAKNANFSFFYTLCIAYSFSL